jgi:hypothetical protein
LKKKIRSGWIESKKCCEWGKKKKNGHQKTDNLLLLPLQVPSSHIQQEEEDPP